MNKLERIQEEEKKVIEVKWFAKDIVKQYDFRKIKTICTFGNDIKNKFINILMANNEQNHLAKCIIEFKSKTNPQPDSNFEIVKEDVLNSEMTLRKGKNSFLKIVLSRLKQSKQS